MSNSIWLKAFQKCYDDNYTICWNTLNGIYKVCYDGYNLEYGKCQLIPSSLIINNFCYDSYFQRWKFL